MDNKQLTGGGMTEKKLWFKAKSYGWGWMPSSWQGWLIIAIYAIFITGATSWVTKRAGGGFIERSGVIIFIGVIILATAILIGICYAKGERPRWRWGKDDNNPR